MFPEMARWISIFLVVLHIWMVGEPLGASSGKTQAAGSVSGFWIDEADSGYLIGIEGSVVSAAWQGQLRSLGTILEQSPRRLVLCEGGWQTSRELILEQDGALIWSNPVTGERRRLRRRTGKPEALEARPLMIPEPMALPPEEIAEIQRQLWQRAWGGSLPQGKSRIPSPEDVLPWRKTREKEVAEDLSVSDLARKAAWARDIDFLKELIGKVGWIDAQRFGFAAFDAAFYFVQHSSDLALMMAALPRIKSDVDAGLVQGEKYALLYDRLHLLLGKKQRYGTQAGIDAANTVFVLQIEDPGKVDELRRGLGMTSLGDYLKVLAHFNRAYAPDKIVFLDGCAQH